MMKQQNNQMKGLVWLLVAAVYALLGSDFVMACPLGRGCR